MFTAFQEQVRYNTLPQFECRTVRLNGVYIAWRDSHLLHNSTQQKEVLHSMKHACLVLISVILFVVIASPRGIADENKDNSSVEAIKTFQVIYDKQVMVYIKAFPELKGTTFTVTEARIQAKEASVWVTMQVVCQLIDPRGKKETIKKTEDQADTWFLTKSGWHKQGENPFSSVIQMNPPHPTPFSHRHPTRRRHRLRPTTVAICNRIMLSIQHIQTA